MAEGTTNEKPRTETKKAEAIDAKPAEETYTAAEFARAAEKFGEGVRDYAILAAFRHAGKERATLDEARKMVAAFRGR